VARRRWDGLKKNKGGNTPFQKSGGKNPGGESARLNVPQQQKSIKPKKNTGSSFFVVHAVLKKKARKNNKTGGTGV